MWWDSIPIAGHPDDPAREQMDETILWVMNATLQLDSIACRESVLHGLGHWHLHYPKQVEGIIQNFLQRNQVLPDNLRTYALSALKGCIL
jgi:hypothetical protein